ncbi:glycosyltransferase family 2 protein [Zunongwangia sp. F260]|uniref:Glycosyltransferase family 2 protein n=1 Tax=Autumnicola lenta TaxID=3075593 RepID=A0ABU3CHS2_9FLAO|nr:glycosyltransferase family 2 protein [Zunongwangia sp. F260]MDT0645899.1 glycosyltransferase family 2 protein [Zunongwangia sp. F260]
MKKTGVVVLTYNRLKYLKIALCKVIAQTHQPLQILVVDNGSTDGTKEYLASVDKVEKIFLIENTGPAGGFYNGIKYFSENTNVDYVWLMDDDFFPFDSCLEILLNATNLETVVFPYVREKNFAFRQQPGWWGVLVPMPIIKRVGYPREDLFFWSEDTEYLQARIRMKYKYAQKWISQAKGVHFTVRQTNARRPWQYYYETRNTIYSRLYIKETTLQRLYKLLRSWIILFLNILVKEDKKSLKFKMFFLGTYHGFFKKLGKRVDPSSGKIIKLSGR